MPKKKVLSPVSILRDGSELRIDDHVVTNLSPKCEGLVFIVCEINDWPACESKCMVVAHLKDFPDRKILGFQKEGLNLGVAGVDSNWYTKIEK